MTVTTTAASATAIDRTEQFKAERLAQIKSIYDNRASAQANAERLQAEQSQRISDGKLVPLGGDSYRVNDPGSWDNGEVWTYRQPRGLDQPLLLPVSNLDETTGRAALYTRSPAWHSLGNVVAEGITDLDEVLRTGGIDFEIVKHQMRYCLDPDDVASELLRPPTQVVPGAFVTVRSDTLAPLGPVGSVYTPIQNRDAGAFLQHLVNDYHLIYESAGATYEGRHVFIGLRLPEDIVLDLGDGVSQTVKAYLYWLNSHDGTTSASVTVSPWNVTCGNTERFNLRDAVARWRTRHTVNAMGRVEEARATLARTVTYFNQFKTEEETLARTNLEIAQFEALVADLYPLDGKPTDRQRRNADERKGTLLGMYANETDRLGKTAYAAERVFTDYMDHAAPRRVAQDRLAAARATALIEGSDDELKTRAHAKLLQFAS